MEIPGQFSVEINSVDKIAGIKLTPEGPVILLGDVKMEQPKPSNEWDEVLK